MNQLEPFSDERLLGRKGNMDQCVYCGGPPETKEHLPTLFLLDDPLPGNLHVVRACRPCNNSFSDDEQYLACLIDVALIGFVSDSPRLRPKVQATLKARPALAASLDAAQRSSSGRVYWEANTDRVNRIVSKLAQGHAAFELSEPMFRPPDRLAVFPLLHLTEEQRRSFERAPTNALWPEVGSRAMRRIIEGCSDVVDGWVVVQPGRYRYLAYISTEVMVRIVLSEFVACEASWD
jgi:hypothetical protein